MTTEIINFWNHEAKGTQADRNLFISAQDIVAQAPTSEAKGEANAFEVIRSDRKKSPCGEADCCSKRWNKKFYITKSVEQYSTTTTQVDLAEWMNVF